MRRDAWVFGYGSLMWDPGFAYLEARPARLRGWHRAFVLLSHEAWGTRQRPGMVLALLPGGGCQGMAYRVAAANWRQTRAYLRRREGAYRHLQVPIEIGAGTATALTFAGDPSHARYAGKLPIATTARLIAQGEGWKGTSRGYLAGTVGAVRRMGRRPEPGLDHLLAAVRAINGEGPISRAR